MRIVRTFSTEDGGSADEEIEIETSPVAFVPNHPSMGVSASASAIDVKFLRVDPGWDGGWHTTPVEQYLAVLSGGFEVTTTDGNSRKFHAGDLLLLADATGKGHHTRMLGDEETWVLAVALD